MVRKDRENSQQSSWLRSRWGMIALAVLVLGGAWGIRSFDSAPSADAQLFRRNASKEKQASATGSKPVANNRAQASNAKDGAANPVVNLAAVVNGEGISRQALGKLCLIRWGKDTLESLINKQLITAACQAQGIVIAPADIEAEIQSISSKFGMSIEQYLSMLHKERDVSETQYRRDIVWPMVALKRLAADKLQVTQEELDREFEAELGAKVQVRMISLTSEKKALQVLQAAKANPDDFPRLAKEFSEDPNSASAKGLIPPVRRHIGEPAVEKAVFALQPGQISEIVKAANQFFIFRCEQHIQPAKVSPQYRQQLMARLRERIVERNLRDASTQIFEQLQNSAQVVNVMNNEAYRKKAPGVAAYVNRKPITLKTLEEECLLRYGREMLDTEINFRLLNQELKRRSLTISEAALNDEVARAAESFGYLQKNGQPDVEAWIKAVTEQEGVSKEMYIREAVWPSVALKQLVAEKVTVSDDDLQKGFQANYGERVEVLAIVLNSQRVAQTVWDMARDNPTNAFFGELAEQYSTEPVSRANYGEIPPIQRFGGQPQIEKEAFRLQPGELSGIVAIGDKFIIMKCLGRTEPFASNLTEVRDELIKDIREKKLRLAMADEFDSLRAKAKIDNFISGTFQTGKSAGSKKRVSAQPVSSQPNKARAQTSKPMRRVQFK